MDRMSLRARIADRFEYMLAQGLIDEVAGLHRRPDLNLSMPALRAVGYRQVWEHLDGKMSYDQMVTAAITATRRLAKRQMTWLRAECDLRAFTSERRPLAALEKSIISHVQNTSSIRAKI
jgi:tRNA dimethylallyltransferase